VLGITENLPFISYIVLRGRCAACHMPIGLRYFATEISAACLAVAMLWHFGATLQALAAFGMAATLLTLALIDANTYLLPDNLTLPLLWVGLLVNLDAMFTPLHSAVIGAAAGYIFLWLVYWIYRFFRQRDGLGYGDFKLLAALGAWLGWSALPNIVFIASCLGTCFGLLTRAGGQLKNHTLPFGPFLAAAGTLALFGQNMIFDIFQVK